MESKSQNEVPQDYGSDKPFGAKVSAWTLHDFSNRLVSPDDRARFREECPGCAPVFFTGQVDKDYRGRWDNGTCMRSSLVVSISRVRDEWFVETENTIYCLSGPGRVSTRVPMSYEFEVTKTLMLLSASDGMKLKVEKGDFIVVPDLPESLLPMQNLIKKINTQNSPQSH